jgi:hypothetical protein
LTPADRARLAAVLLSQGESAAETGER